MPVALVSLFAAHANGDQGGSCLHPSRGRVTLPAPARARTAKHMSTSGTTCRFGKSSVSISALVQDSGNCLLVSCPDLREQRHSKIFSGLCYLLSRHASQRFSMARRSYPGS
ncbi:MULTISPECIES: hypothetical protein [unclassified Micromonospora]|uniref:hypothetical protein n=1 Tax=unclassified Micromonospora TaxID=2617518 RepID=UPI001183F596|nr:MULTISPECIES: hypothetical protein [unclassified Micromonospora]MDI5938367.1 hypothetical protein [Micromonospora sp. DH15]